MLMRQTAAFIWGLSALVRVFTSPTTVASVGLICEGYCPCSDVFSTGPRVFLPPQKPS